MPAIRLGDLLVKAKVITDSQLKSALAEQSKWGGKLGEILVRMHIVTEDMLVKALSKQLNTVAVNLDAVASIPPHVRGKIPAETARDLSVLPLQLQEGGKALVVVMCEPQNLRQLDTLRSLTRCRIIPQVAGRQAIARAFTRFYEGEAEVGPDEPGFKLVNAQNQTLIKNIDDIQPRAEPPPRAVPPPAPPRPPAPSRTPADSLRALEDTQRKEVSALKAMVEMLIEKGVFTREEYLAKVKR